MLIKINVAGQHADEELRSLYAWLREDADIRRHVRMSLAGDKPAEGEMGGALDVIQLIVDGGFQAASLAIAYASWRATRPVHPRVVIEAGGAKVELEDADPEAIEAIVRALT